MPKTIPTLENFVNLFERAKLEKAEFAEAVDAMKQSNAVAALEACFKKKKTLGVYEDSVGNTLLHYAAYFGRKELVEICKKNYVGLSTKNQFDMHAGHLAAFYGKTEVLHHLYSKGGIPYCIKVKALNQEMLCSALQIAILNAQKETAIYLIEKHPDGQDLRAGEIGNLCHLMAFTRDGSIIPYLMSLPWLEKHQSMLRECNGQYFYTPLMLAASVGNVSAIDGFTDVPGLDINFTSLKDGRTALHVAVESESNINELNDVCENEVDLYPEISILKSVEKLIQKGANINAQDFLKRTPLYCAVAAGHYEMVALLLDKHADVTIAARQGITPILLAKQLSEENNQYDNRIISLLENPGMQKEVVNTHVGLSYGSIANTLLPPPPITISNHNNVEAEKAKQLQV